MSSTLSDTLQNDHETISPPMERTHFTRMAGLYAWILVTLVIFILAAMLSGIQKSQAAAGPDRGHIQATALLTT